MEYSRSVLQLMVAQLCQNKGFDGVSTMSIDTLTDILQAYIEEIGHVAHNAAELANRTEANAHDVVLALDDSHMSISELTRYCQREAELPLCHDVRQIPVRKRKRAVEPRKSGEAERKPHIHDCLPSLPAEYTWKPSEVLLLLLCRREHGAGSRSVSAAGGCRPCEGHPDQTARGSSAQAAERSTVRLYRR
jgi:histone H3/H4